MFMDPMYLVFALPALLLGMYAQLKVKSAYGKWSQVANSRGVAGVQAAQELLQVAGLSGVNIEGVAGNLSDHYDPRSKTLRLSRGVATQPSVAAVAIVAHEVGHAQQDATNYSPMRLRSSLVPAVQIGSWVGPILFIAGAFMASTGLMWAGVIGFAGAAVFSLVTLPVELNASSRAMSMLQSSGLVTQADLPGAKAVLEAAALTYVAALVQSIGTLLYYVTLLSGMRRD